MFKFVISVKKYIHEPSLTYVIIVKASDPAPRVHSDPFEILRLTDMRVREKRIDY